MDPVRSPRELVDRYVAGVLPDAVRTAGIEVGSQPPAGLEVVTRSTATDSYTFLINHTDADAEYPATGRDLLAGGHISGTAVIPAGTVCVIHTRGEAS
ncbi:Beta-galactosidase C-terminal domain [Pseudarthrobacter sp.]|uniref:Beta-galactosidase C-terminal domain n=1 Tax=Pseudarthrobacter sp. TaxID=1934409 RepID=UPI002FC936AF